MKKEEIRLEFFKLKNKGVSYAKCRTLLLSQFDYLVSVRTLKRWVSRLDTGSWDLMDASRRPKKLYFKVSSELIKKVCLIREQTGWGQDKILQKCPELGISASSIKRIIKAQGLSRKVKLRGKRVKWVRWQRAHPNSLWQIDHSDEQDKEGTWTLSVIDDCSRYSLTLVKLKNVTTTIVTHILDRLIIVHGKPREILSDNGSAYGGTSKHSKFDRWCHRRGIKHIRSSIHSPTTCGKVERLFQTIDKEIQYCNNDQELFRLRYNHHRPHSSLSGRTPAEVYFGR
ncbi:transposase family protein [Candidatus Woesearchaeota archaeon]|nr:transposase family protein [Candidatus Woesearchaeota archaeon]